MPPASARAAAARSVRTNAWPEVDCTRSARSFASQIAALPAAASPCAVSACQATVRTRGKPFNRARGSGIAASGTVEGSRRETREADMTTHHWVDTFHDPFAFAHKAGAWLIVTALAFLVLGTLAILAPLAAGLAVSAIVGWLLIASGVMHGVNAFRTESITRSAEQVFVGLFYLVAGLYFLAHP